MFQETLYEERGNDTMIKIGISEIAKINEVGGISYSSKRVSFPISDLADSVYKISKPSLSRKFNPLRCARSNNCVVIVYKYKRFRKDISQLSLGYTKDDGIETIEQISDRSPIIGISRMR